MTQKEAGSAQMPPTRYETLLIANPEIQKEAVEELVKKATATLKKYGANLTKSTEWGRRRLAFEIKKQTDGYYMVIEFDGRTEAVKRFQDFLGLHDQVLRYMTTKKDSSLESPLAEIASKAE